MRFSLLSRYFSPAFRPIPPYDHRVRFKNMTTETPDGTVLRPSISANVKVNKLQQLLHSDSSNGWEECWKEDLTPWDLGRPTPVLVHLNNTGSLPKGRALVPICGSGRDVVALACAERHVVGLDISDSAIKKAAQLSYGSPNAENFTFFKTDFFTWCPAELFDLIFDYTVKITVGQESKRSPKAGWGAHNAYVSMDNHEGGPPYKVSVADYEEVLRPVGFKATYIAENELAIAPRMGEERISDDGKDPSAYPCYDILSGDITVWCSK
ncbi:hypothetical protein OROMI_006403 [Orobanche minor]